MGLRLKPLAQKMVSLDLQMGIFHMLVVLLSLRNVASSSSTYLIMGASRAKLAFTTDTPLCTSQHGTSPVSETVDSLVTSSWFLDRTVTHMNFEGNSHFGVRETVSVSIDKIANFRNDHEQMFAPSSTDVFIDIAENIKSKSQQVGGFSLIQNTAVPHLEPSAPELSFSFQTIVQTMPSNELFTGIQIKDDFHPNHISTITDIDTTDIFPSTTISVISEFSSSDVSVSISLDSNRFKTKENFFFDMIYDMISKKLSTTQKLNTDTCESSCFLSNNKDRMSCGSFLPCHIPETVRKLLFRLDTTNEPHLVKEQHLRFNKSSRFNSITSVELHGRGHYLISAGDFLMLLPSLDSVFVNGEIVLGCYKGVLSSVRNYFVKNCVYNFIDISLVLRLLQHGIACFPNLEKLRIERCLFKLPKPFIDLIFVPFRIDLSAVRSVLPRLKFFIVRFGTHSTVSYEKITVYDSNEDSCRNSSPQQIIFSNIKIWQTEVNIASECKNKLVIFKDMQTRSIIPLQKLNKKHIRGFQKVVFWLKSRSCVSNATLEPFVNIVFSPGGSLHVQRFCKYKKNKISVENYNKKITYILWFIHLLELSIEPVIKADLSNFNLSYIMFYDGDGDRTSSIQNLTLSHNHLGLMTKNQSGSFEKILYAFTNLEKIDLAYNGIKELPENIFAINYHLKIVLLSNNKLSVLRIEQFRNLANLTTLDVSNNHIKMLGVFQLLTITSFLSPRNGTIINIMGNLGALKCTCTDFATFIALFASIENNTFIVTRHCETELDNIVSIPELEGYCLRQKLKLIQKCSLAIAGGLVLVGIAIFAVVWKIRKQQRLINRFVNNVRHGHAKKEFLIFLSYSSKDGETVHRLIMPEIARRVLERTGVDKEHICTGDTHFIPGFNIIQEAMRCIDLCSVVVFVLTKSFVRSPFCRMEVKEALDQAKPIILIIKEKTDPNKMPRIIKNIFNKYSRFHFIRGIKGVRVLPGWDLLVSAIFDLAANEEKDLKCLEKIEDGDKEKKRRYDEVEMLEIK